MSATVIEISIVFFLIIANGVLAMSETAILSARKARLKEWADDGDKAAKLAWEIANSPTEFLSTVQVGITLVGIFAGAFAGATLAEELAVQLKKIAILAPVADLVSMGFVVSLITYFSLIIGELVPKRIALNAPERIARLVAPPMSILSLLAKPLVVLLSLSTGFVIRLLGIRNVDQVVSEGEIHIMVEQAAQAGVFELTEQEMVTSVLQLDDRRVASIMTPRTDIVWVDIHATEADLLQVMGTSLHTRFLVADQSLDNVLGVVDSKKIMHRLLSGLPIDLRAMLTQPDCVPENTTALELLDQFRNSRQHIALVINEYGGIQGLVTRDDIFEAIVGELPTHDELPKWEAHKRQDGTWLFDGQTPLQDFKKTLGLSLKLEEDTADYHTLAGFLLFHLERVPQVGETFEWQNLRFEIVDMDRHRIDKILVSLLQSK